MTPTPFEDQLAQVRHRKAVARNCIRRAGVTLNDPADYRVFRDAQEMIVRSLEREEAQLRALLHQPKRPPVSISKARSRRTVVLAFNEFRDLLLEGRLKQWVGNRDFQVSATRRQMAGLAQMIKCL